MKEQESSDPDGIDFCEERLESINICQAKVEKLKASFYPNTEKCCDQESNSAEIDNSLEVQVVSQLKTNLIDSTSKAKTTTKKSSDKDKP